MIFNKYSPKVLLTCLAVMAVFVGCQSDFINDVIDADGQTATSFAPVAGTVDMSAQSGARQYVGTSGLLPGVSIGSGTQDSVGGSVSGLVTPLNGGTLVLSTSRLVVHPLAVVVPTLVTFSITPTKPVGLRHPLNRLYDFAPDGLHFLVPSTLYVSFSDAGLGNEDPEEYWLCYFNTGTNRWEKQPTFVDMQNQRFIVQLNHFSRYAFAR